MLHRTIHEAFVFPTKPPDSTGSDSVEVTEDIRLSGRLSTATWLASALIVLALSGCIPLKQAAFEAQQPGDHFGYYGSYGLLTIGSSSKKRAVKLVPEHSFAISPSGRRYSIRTKPHDYDLSQGHTYIRDQIRIYDSKGRHKTSLSDGKWTFVFAVDTGGRIEEHRFGSDVWTFFYNPVLHGPPN